MNEIKLLQQTDAKALQIITVWNEFVDYGNDATRYALNPTTGKIMEAMLDNASTTDDFDDESIWGTLQAGGSSEYVRSVEAITADTTYTASGTHFEVNTTSNAVTLTLPDATTLDDGSSFSIHSLGSNVCSVVTPSGNSINGANSIIVTSESYSSFVLDGTNWVKVMEEENSYTSTSSHLVGFYTEDGVLFVDLLSLTSMASIDTSKYNMEFADGTPSWRILAGAVTVEHVNTLGIDLVEV